MRVIPGFCRMALEAACSLAVTRRLLRTGTSYAAAQEQLAQPTTLLMWLALALLKDASRSGDVYEHLKRQHPQAADPVRDCNRGAHEGWQPRDPKGFIRDIERLSKAITGDAALPHCWMPLVCVWPWNSLTRSWPQIGLPFLASRQLSFRYVPMTYTRSPSTAGVVRGPLPP